MDEVSRHAGMSKKTVYRLFSSKAEIFEVLLQNWAHPFNVPFAVDGRPQREVLSQALFRLATFALDDIQIAISRVLIAEAARPGDVADALAELGIGRGHWALEQWLESQTMLGRYRIGDPVELAAMIFHAVIGDALFKLLLRVSPRPSDAAIVARIERVVGMYFEG
jgi:AcrR family transcriptional regulator